MYPYRYTIDSFLRSAGTSSEINCEHLIFLKFDVDAGLPRYVPDSNPHADSWSSVNILNLLHVFASLSTLGPQGEKNISRYTLYTLQFLTTDRNSLSAFYSGGTIKI